MSPWNRSETPLLAAAPVRSRAAAVIAFPPVPAGAAPDTMPGNPAPDFLRAPARDRVARLARLREALPGAEEAGAPVRVARPVRRAAEAAAPRAEPAWPRGVGPGLAWALGRAGIADLAALAALEPGELVARLGPLGRLIPARAWIEAARETVGAAPAV